MCKVLLIRFNKLKLTVSTFLLWSLLATDISCIITGWEFYHENSIRAASTSDLWERVTGKEGVKKRWGFPLLLSAILFKELNLNFTTFVKNSVWGFFFIKMCFIGLRSWALLSISALSGRRGQYAHAYGICAPFYCISLKIIYGWGV